MITNWLKVSLLLCVFGFFRELRPSEPYSTEFFIAYRNLTTDDITQILYPLGTYSYMFQLILVFLVTDILRWVVMIRYYSVFFLLISYLICFFVLLHQLQASHHIFGVLWVYGVRVYVVDRRVRWPGICATVLWDIHGDRSCILHVHLCKSWTKKISNCYRTHAFGNFGWTIFGRRVRSTAYIVRTDELQRIELSVIWR